MTDYTSIPVVFVALMTLATIGLGLYATRKAKTASDFFVAGRSVSVFWNASAISGEYLSAASFMGIAGLLMKNGYDALWYPVCYATGYLFLLLFIAGPLRRFGAYTIPDFAEGRFDSPGFRKVAVTFVLFIGFFYTMPQMKGAGLTMGTILHWPYWAGIVIVGVVITFNVAFGGMKGITFVQAFQYWAKLFAISIPIFVLGSVLGGYSTNFAAIRATKDNGNWGVDAIHADPTTHRISIEEPIGEPIPRLRDSSRVRQDTTLTIKGAEAYPSNVLAFSPEGPAVLVFPRGAIIDKVWIKGRILTHEEISHPHEERFEPGILGLIVLGDRLEIPVGGFLEVLPYTSNRPSNINSERIGPARAATFEFKSATTAILKSGSYAPNSPPDQAWLRPFGRMTSKYGYPLLYTYSLIIALICGTAGLPHILVRFYTNPDGRAAKRTTLWVMVMLGSFYVFPPVWGTLGRNAMPWLYANSSTDAVVIRLPTVLKSPLWGQVLSGITSAGAFAAFMSTFSGLLVSMSGALAHDIYGKMLRPNASNGARLVAFKVSAVLIGVISMGLGFLVESFDIAMMVGWAFAIAACSYFPLLLLGAWWPGLTKVGAAGGMLGGGLLALSAIVTSMLLDKKVFTFEVSPLTRSLLEQPAIWGVPLSIGLMVVLSKATTDLIPKDVNLKMLRLHAPEELGLSKNYIDH